MAAAQPHGGDPTTMSQDGDVQAARLRRFLRWFIPILLIFAPFDITTGFMFGNPGTAALGVVLVGIALVCMVALRRLREGHVESAATLTALSILGPILLMAVLRPPLYPVLAMGPLLAISVALPFLHGRPLRAMIGVAWFVTVAVVLVGVNLAPDAHTQLPTLFQTVTFSLALMIVVGLVLLMLWQFSGRMSETLAATQRAHGELRRSHEQLAEVDQFKTRFMNQAAHELNTPLTPVLLQLHLLRARGDGPWTENDRKSLDVVERNVERMGHLVNDLLDATRVQSHRLALHVEPLDLNQVAKETVTSFAAPARAAHVRLESHLTPGLVVRGDERRLVQVVYNLVSNALKFTPAGGSIIVETQAAAGEAMLRVTDTGVGFKPEDSPKLFQPFSQLEDSMVQAHRGTGLGLFISKGIIEDHGGHVSAASPGPGRGATFSLALPLGLEWDHGKTPGPTPA